MSHLPRKRPWNAESALARNRNTRLLTCGHLSHHAWQRFFAKVWQFVTVSFPSLSSRSFSFLQYAEASTLSVSTETTSIIEKYHFSSSSLHAVLIFCLQTVGAPPYDSYKYCFLRRCKTDSFDARGKCFGFGKKNSISHKRTIPSSKRFENTTVTGIVYFLNFSTFVKFIE